MIASSPGPGVKPRILPLCVTLVCTLTLCGVPIGCKPPATPLGTSETSSGQPKFSQKQSQQLVSLRNQALGDVENHEFAKADAALTEIGKLLPDDPFALQNLAICRQLALEAADRSKDPDDFQRKVDQATTAVKAFKDKEPTSPIARLLSARVAMKLDQPDEALTELREAVRLAPDALGPAYDLFQFTQVLPGDQYQEESFRALKVVYQQEPKNLFVIKDWLPALAQRKSAELSEALKQAQSTIAPFVEMIKVHTRVDLNQLIESALKDVADGNWQKVQRSMTVLKNLIISEAARDRRYVMLDSLEYLVPNFSAATRARLDESKPDSAPVSNPIHFLPPAELAGWPTLGAGDQTSLVVTDFNLDGRPDMIVLRGNQLAAWGRKTMDQPWSVIATAELDGVFTGAIALDLDDDVDTRIQGLRSTEQTQSSANIESPLNGSCHAADPDVILFGPAGLKLFENEKDSPTSRTLVEKNGGDEFVQVRDAQSVVVADLDSDGDLDLIVSTAAGLKIFSNRGNLTFEDTTARSQLPPPGTRISALAIVDWDKDTDLDVLFAHADGAGLLENVRHGQLTYRELKEFSSLKGMQSLNIADLDGNTSWDVVGSTSAGAQIILTDRTPAGIVNPQKISPLPAQSIRSVNTGDFDNDGQLDILLWNDDRVTVLFSREAVGFNPQTFPVDERLKQIFALAAADLDRDGDLDLAIAGFEKLIVMSSQCQESDNPDHGWLELQLVGERVRAGEQNWDKRVNHINLGGTIEVRSGNRYQAQMITGPTTHFGLGLTQKADLARVIWTNGIPSNLMTPSNHQLVCIEQKLVGSCPYLYAWNGDRFEFVTDLLWNAPLGLKFAERVVAPWREWEYLKIDGHQLQPLNQEYQLRITAELWEAEYFDQIRLWAIDHPEGTQIFTNEKVGPAELAEHKIHTVHSPRLPVAAHDSYGRDLLALITARDNNYTKTFDRRLAQGFTEEHYLELDLGEFPHSEQITLFLTGWMFPGSTSLRVQHSQNPDWPAMKNPALWVPDADGQWREIRPFMGFPGGKTKTIAVDLSEVFAGNDHRLRFVSTLEIYWDAAFFTVDDERVDYRQTELSLKSANLVDRGGVSLRFWPSSGHGPDQFDYSQLRKGSHWPGMSGKFTRYGNVLPLLTARDDQLVVLYSGDEMQLVFAQPEPALPAGWVRDFVIYNVGWDKDADQNTVYGDTVEPMPFEGMTEYAHRHGEPRPLDAAYVKFLNEYQTRTIPRAKFWKSVKRAADEVQ